MDVAVPARPAVTARAARTFDAAAVAVPLFGTAMLVSGFLLFLVPEPRRREATDMTAEDDHE